MDGPAVFRNVLILTGSRPDGTCGWKVLVPVLGDEYEHILRNHELQLQVEQNTFMLRYHEHRFPLAPASEARLPKKA